MKPLLLAASVALAFSSPAFAAGVKHGDAKILKDMAGADMAEVQAGKAASSKASSDDVKKFAQQMQDDHGKNLSEVQSLAQQKSVDLPSSPPKKDQRAMSKVDKLSGAQFDKAYMDEMVKDHQKDLKDLQKAAAKAKDAGIKSEAQKTAQVVQQHLQMAQQIDQSLSNGASQGSSAASQGSSKK